MKRPIESDYTSFVAYARALEQYCDKAEKQKPVAWMTINSYGDEDDIWYENPEGHLLEGWTYKPLYTHPPKREWQGLALEDKQYLNEVLNLQGRFPIIDAIEAKLKEKNT